MLRRFSIWFAVVLGLLLAASPAALANVAARECRSQDPAPRRLEFGSGSDRTYWLVSRPATRPRGLVALAHGYDDTAEDFQRHLPLLASRGLIAVAPNFRGTKNLPDQPGDEDPESTGMPIWAGAQDLVAATRYFDDICRGLRARVVAGFSVGGLVAAVAASWAPTRRGGAPLFDHLVMLAPMSDTTGAWWFSAAPAQLDPGWAQLRADMEAEMGGTPLEVPDEYSKRSPFDQAGAISRSGVRSAVVITPALDGTAPAPTIAPLAVRLRAEGLPTEHDLIVTRASGDPAAGTMVTNLGVEDPLFAGHDERVNTETGRALLRHVIRLCVDDGAHGRTGPRAAARTRR